MRMKHRRKSRIQWVARLMRRMDRERTAAPQISPWEAHLFAVSYGYQLRRERVYAK